MNARCCLPLIVLLASCSAVSKSASPDESRRAFQPLLALEGEWEGKSTQGWVDRMSFQKIACGSVLLELSKFEAHPGETMATAHHLDGDRLVLTHYCVAGNQPRLVLGSTSEDGAVLRFTFLDGTNMTSRDKGHMDQAVIHFLDADHFTSRWTWYQDGAEQWLEDIEYRRIALAMQG
jgi:GH24 family phage-related lysozyme (muramidase)